ncbi:MAG: hypothetical protein ACE5J5_08320 [Candidatus Hydrothermarchaeales archaeon]
MGKTEDMLEDLTEKIDAMADRVANMEFSLIQALGSGGMPSGSPDAGGPAPMGPVNVDLAPLEAKLGEIASQVTSSVDMERLYQEMRALSTGKVEQAENLISRTTMLLEKGLQLTEMETTLLEIKDRLQEVVIQLQALVVSTEDKD